ncbi:MAG TPA: hypothetical protein VJB59_08135 [Bdellovibrionota bacterium]|nr:hypothetical protein [Bdellovibrionota bacterium]
MKTFISVVALALLVAAANLSGIRSASAMELDWGGQFRAEANMIHNYTMDSSDKVSPDARLGQGGYYIPPAGSNSANFQNLFLKLRPKLVVNDNIYVRSEWWFGDPIFGLFGNAAPYAPDQRQFYSTQSRGSTITAQRFWAEILSDFGTFHLGRAPLHWGLGIVWNSGDNLWDRYESTGDVIRLVSKFGAFSFIPSYVSYSMGNTVGGSCTYVAGTGCVPTGSGGQMTDYSLILKYENPDEELEGGVNFIKRIAGASQDPGVPAGTAGYRGLRGVPEGMNYNTWDLFGRKKLGKFTLAGEVPITTGHIGGVDYSSYAIAAEADWKLSEMWQIDLRAGHAPGSVDKVFYFNPNYHLAMIMFNYQLANLSGLQTLNNPAATPSLLASPYDNPIVNANYLSIKGHFKTDKWDFHATWAYAKAVHPAVAGQSFFNTWTRNVVVANTNQDSSLGWEMDYGALFQWDDNFQFGADIGFYFPGAFYKFSNAASGVENATNTVWATNFRAGVNF